MYTSSGIIVPVACVKIVLNIEPYALFVKKGWIHYNGSYDAVRKCLCFWNNLKVALKSLNVTATFDIKDLLFGTLDKRKISILVHYILLKSMYFIHRFK